MDNTLLSADDINDFLYKNMNKAFFNLNANPTFDEDINQAPELLDLLAQLRELSRQGSNIMHSPNKDAAWRRQVEEITTKVTRLSEQYTQAYDKIILNFIREYNTKLASLIKDLSKIINTVHGYRLTNIQKYLDESNDILAANDITARFKWKLKLFIEKGTSLLEKTKGWIEEEAKRVAKLKSDLPEINKLYDTLKNSEYREYVSREQLDSYESAVRNISASDDSIFLSKEIPKIIMNLRDSIYRAEDLKFEAERREQLLKEEQARQERWEKFRREMAWQALTPQEQQLFKTERSGGAADPMAMLAMGATAFGPCLWYIFVIVIVILIILLFIYLVCPYFKYNN